MSNRFPLSSVVQLPRVHSRTLLLSRNALAHSPCLLNPVCVRESHTIVAALLPLPHTSAKTPFHAPKAKLPLASATQTPDAMHIQNIETRLQALPALAALRNRADAHEWYETRPYRNYPEALRKHSLTAGTLCGLGKLAVAALIRARKDESESVVIIHLGRDLCGHDGIVHGGMVATLLDEALGRTGMNNLPGRVGFTANLLVNYRAPTKADQVWIEGWMEDLQGTVLADAKTMYIQPAVKTPSLDTNTLRLVLGEPEPDF